MKSKVNDVFEELFDISSDAQLILKKGKVTRYNVSASFLFGVRKTRDLLSKDPFQFSPELQPNGEKSSVMAENYLNEAISLGNARFEWLHQFEKEEIWTEYSLTPLGNSSNQLLAIIRTIEEIKTRQITTEERIEKLIAQNQALTELSTLENDPDFKLSGFKKKLLELTISTLGVDHAAIWLKKGQKLKRDLTISAEKSSYDLGSTITFKEFPRFDRALIDHQLAVINDSFKDPRSNEFKIRVKPGHGSSSLLYVTIIWGSDLIGFLWIENAGVIRKWEYEEQSFAVAMGEMLAKQVGAIQKKKVEKKLEQSEKVFKALIEHSLDVVCIVDKKGEFTYQSPSFERVLGFGPNELMGLKALDFVHPDDFRSLKKKFLRLVAKHESKDTFTYRAKHKNGKWVFVEALVNNLLHQREIDGMVINIRDITERMRFQDRLQEQEEYYRTLIERSLEVTVVRDKSGIIKYVSPSVEMVFGLKEKDLLGKREFATTHPDDLHHFESDWQYLVENPERPMRLDQRIKLPNGKMRYIEGMVRNLLDVKPVNGIVMNFRDVTNRKKAESALIESQMRLEGIISSALDAIITVDSNQNIVLFNDAAEKMFKQHAFEVFGKSMELLIPKESRKVHKKNVEGFYDSSIDKQKMRASNNEQLYGLRSDGSHFPIDASISKQTIEDEVFFTAVIRDVTEQLKSEQVLKQYNKTLEGEVKQRTLLLNRKNKELNKTLEELKNTQEQLVESEKMASLGQLTAGIAHEINNPINFVTSTLSPLKRDFKAIKEIMEKFNKIGNGSGQKNPEEVTFLFEEISQLLGGIEEGANRTKNIVLGLRNFSRLDEESFKKADIHDGLESTLMLLKSRIKGRIDVEKAYGQIPMVECLPGKINQVFMNILSNAIQAIKEKGSISISTIAQNDRVRIAISDTGQGMSKEVQKRIFEPFFTTKDVGVGTGLGLSISYGIIENHGGSIEVKSKIGKGTTFVISLPVSQL